MRNVLIASFDMELGGVERSLLNMLHEFDYHSNEVDLMLYRHQGELLEFLPDDVHLLKESPVYKTYRMPIRAVIKAGKIHLAAIRLFAKWKAAKGDASENGYKQMQFMWKYALPFLPKRKKKYDVAISYLWPHYYVAKKVNAHLKIAWVHTDFSMAETDVEMDIAMWKEFDYIVAVSKKCELRFLEKYPMLRKKMMVIENITAPGIVRRLATEKVENPMDTDTRFKLVTVARLSHAKGIDQAVCALRLIKDKGYNFAWYVVGYGGDEAMVRELIAKENLEDDFFLLGKKINPYPFMKAADLYVQPSRYEGKAVTVGEAQILAKPVLITNYPTAGSQVDDGVDGVICDLSVEGIVDGVVRVYDDPNLRKNLQTNCEKVNYHNHTELEKLYHTI